jgi:uracil phosphoribosyltransferase
VPTTQNTKPKTSSASSRVHILSHPLVAQQIALLRDKNTEPPVFRSLIGHLSSLLLYEASRNFPLKKVTVKTPLQLTHGQRIDARIALVPILRAGLGMVESILDVIPNSRVCHVGVKRNEETLEPMQYYSRLPEENSCDIALVLDPMLATGGSACKVISELKKKRIPKINFLGIIAAPEGLQRLTREHPDVDVYLCVLDEKLNEHGYILPGLGDAGDRQFS